MTLGKKLFRESALQRLQSPEQLDQVLQVTNPRGWLALVAIWSLLALVVLWAVFGTIPSKEYGRGILVAGGGHQVIEASGTGRLRGFTVGVGEMVAEDQIVAKIDKNDLGDELKDARSQLAQMRVQQQELDAFDARERILHEELAAEQIDRLEGIIEFAGERIVRLTKRREIIAGELDKGFLTEIDLHEVDDLIERAAMERRQSQLQIEQNRAELQRAEMSRTKAQLERRIKLEELERRITLLEDRIDRESQVRSRTAGRIMEVRAAEGTEVVVGQPLLLLEPAEIESAPLEAIVYVSAATGKLIEIDDEVQVSPSTVKREEHGSMVGRVVERADTPTSQSQMMVVLNDRDLVAEMRTGGVPLQVRIALERDPETPSGYAWTSGDGPPTAITAGTLCEAWVTVDKERPIELVIPMLRSNLGAR